MLKELLSDFLNLIYPNVCTVCGCPLLKEEEAICSECIYKLPKTRFHLIQDNKAQKLFWGKVNVEFASSFFYFQKGTVSQKVLHHLKYKGGKEIGKQLGKQFGAELKKVEQLKDIDYIIPVPLHKNKFKKRGYNQSEMIANGLSEILNIPVETSNLLRVIENPTQTKKGTYERWENTSGVFALSDQHLFKNKHILLVDDVLTTGATVEACINALCITKDVKVSFVSLAIA